MFRGVNTPVVVEQSPAPINFTTTVKRKRLCTKTYNKYNVYKDYWRTSRFVSIHIRNTTPEDFFKINHKQLTFVFYANVLLDLHNIREELEVNKQDGNRRNVNEITWRRKTSLMLGTMNFNSNAGK